MDYHPKILARRGHLERPNGCLLGSRDPCQGQHDHHTQPENTNQSHVLHLQSALPQDPTADGPRLGLRRALAPLRLIQKPLQILIRQIPKPVIEVHHEAHPDDVELILWINGSIFGVVAAFVTLNHDDAGLGDITKAYACICIMINDTLDRYGCFNLEQYAQDFLVRVGADDLQHGPDPVA